MTHYDVCARVCVFAFIIHHVFFHDVMHVKVDLCGVLLQMLYSKYRTPTRLGGKIDVAENATQSQIWKKG